MSKKIVISDSDKDAIIVFVNSTYQCTIKKICEKFGYPRHTVTDFLKEFDLINKIYKGMLDETKIKLSQKCSNYFWCNNGIQSIQVKTGEPIPEGYVLGRVVNWELPERTQEEKDKISNKVKESRISHYGTYYTDEMKEKTKQTLLERYGQDNYNNKEKSTQTKLLKYGNATYNNREKAKQTAEERYGGTGRASTELRQKQEATMLQRYGVTHNWASTNEDLNGSSTRYANYGGKEAYYQHVKEKGSSTKLMKYGDANYSNHEQAIKTMLRKYGVPYFCMSPKCREKLENKETILKRFETMAKKGTYNTSKVEEMLYKDLCTIFGEPDVKRQYRDDRYPFNCDFYIVSVDLFIELNAHWTHNTHPYSANNIEDENLLKIWKDKSGTSDFYKTAIYVWTELDVKKQEYAIKNNLNYIAIYKYKGEFKDEFCGI